MLPPSCGRKRSGMPTQDLYDASGHAVGYARGRYIHAMSGEAIDHYVRGIAEAVGHSVDDEQSGSAQTSRESDL